MKFLEVHHIIANGGQGDTSHEGNTSSFYCRGAEEKCCERGTCKCMRMNHGFWMGPRNSCPWEGTVTPFPDPPLKSVSMSLAAAKT
jgi:hypothetical protein